MSNRKTIIDTLRTLNSATILELAGATGWDEYKVRNTVHDMRQAKLVSSRLDDITGKPIYALTADGKAWKPSKKTCDTPAGGGDISPAPENRTTSLAACIPGEVSGVVEQPAADDSPQPAGSDEIRLDELFDIDIDDSDPDDDSDPAAFRRARIVCSASSDGQTTIHRFGSIGIVLTARETRQVYEFLADSARIWGARL